MYFHLALVVGVVGLEVMNESSAAGLGGLDVAILSLLLSFNFGSNIVDVALDFMDGGASGKSDLNGVEEGFAGVVCI